MYRSPMVNDANTNARSHRDVCKAFQILSGAPAQLAERRAVDVGIEVNRSIDAVLERTHEVRVLPPRFGRTGDEAVSRRGWLEVQRPEGAYTECRQDPKLVSGSTEIAAHISEGRRRITGLDAGFIKNKSVFVPYGANKFGTAGLDRTEKPFCVVLIHGGPPSLLANDWKIP